LFLLCKVVVFFPFPKVLLHFCLLFLSKHFVEFLVCYARFIFIAAFFVLCCLLMFEFLLFLFLEFVVIAIPIDVQFGAFDLLSTVALHCFVEMLLPVISGGFCFGTCFVPLCCLAFALR